MQIVQTYNIQIDVVDEDDATSKLKKKYISAIFLKEFPCFYLFQAKNYKTTIHKQDCRRKPMLIMEV
jgi:hypothetical protein